MMDKITGLHPKVADAISATITEAKARGLTVGLHSGLRSQEKQTSLYELGRVTVNPDGKSIEKPMGNIVTMSQTSYHCMGLAGDVVFKDEKGWTWNKTPEQWEELGKIGEMFGLEWGGRWKMKDYPHFQMRGKISSTKEAYKILTEKGIDALWALV